jgi:hypothetical protein
MTILGVVLARLACMLGWNAAAHRKDASTERAMSILFYAFTAVLFALFVQVAFFRS